MELAPLDYAVLVLFSLALLRGLVRGLVRETFSIASLAVAVVMVRVFYGQVADWLIQTSEGDISTEAAPWLAGALIVVTSIAVVTLAGRFLRRGAKAAGLGWADRAGGAVIGAAEGALVAGLLVGLIGYVMGRDHEVLVESRSVQALEDLEHFAKTGELPRDFELPDIPIPELPTVAAPPPARLAEAAGD